MSDSVALEKMGIPTVTVVTEPFEAAARAPARALGMADLPLVVIVAFLASGRSPMRAAFWGVVTGGVITLLRTETRLDAARIREALLTAARGSVQVAAACAAAGIVVGVASLTGIGLRMSELIITLSQGNLFGALLLTGVLEALLYGVSVTDPVTFLVMIGALTFVALLASWIPARRAGSTDPVRILREE